MCQCVICGEEINNGLLMVAGEPCHKDCHTDLMEEVYNPHVDPLEDFIDDEDSDTRFNSCISKKEFKMMQQEWNQEQDDFDNLMNERRGLFG